ncbi:MAG TPA: thymidylate kinase [Candidatus Dormibacteraeota bacterium]|nr:thymidylate kinase [Candidatus Dormibacteraeota bacterium]
MPPRGKLLAVEGIDGAGKHTQVELLARALERRGIAHLPLSFPHYQSFFGQAVGQYLSGDFGRLDQVDPHFSALLYAGDRLEAKGELESALAAGRLVLADRYVGSNLAHQGARVGPAHRAEFLSWVRRLEYEIFGLPRENMVIYLRIPAEEAIERMASRAKKLSRDIQEGDRQHLEDAAAVYDSLAKSEAWAVVESFDPGAKRPRPPGEIHREILALCRSRLGVDGGTAASAEPPDETARETGGH